MIEDKQTNMKKKGRARSISRVDTGNYWLFGSLFFSIPGTIVTGLFIEILPDLQVWIWILSAAWVVVGLAHYFPRLGDRLMGWTDIIFGMALIALDVVLIVALARQWALAIIMAPFLVFTGAMMVCLVFGVFLGNRLRRGGEKHSTGVKSPRKTLLVSGIAYIVLVCGAFGGVVGLIGLRVSQTNAQNATYMASNQAQHDALDLLFPQHDRVVDGFNWHYVDTGNSTGTVILFLHGLPEGWYSWRYVLPLVNQSFRLIALDIKGYGRSSTGPGDTSANATNFDWKVISQQILDLTSSLNISKFYVVGHDWGSIIGSLLVTQFPDHVLGFVRMEAPITLATVDQTNSPQFILFRSARMGALFMGDAQWFIDNVYSSRMLKPFNATDQMYITYEFARPGVAERIVQYFSTRNLQYMPDLFARLCNTTWSFPILLLQADSDPAQPKSYFDGLSTTCSHVQLQWITEASHFSNFDQPGQVAAAINAFVK